jgi:hypothetical protein
MEEALMTVGGWSGLVPVAVALLIAPAVEAQENMISPPAPLQRPVIETDPAVRTGIEVALLRDVVEERANVELCRDKMKRASRPIPEGFDWLQCPADLKAEIANREGLMSWVEGARPSECGEECVGRPFVTQSTHTDRPNTFFAMLFGHLDFRVDSTFDRDVRFGYEALFFCQMDADARTGRLIARTEFGRPVVGEAGVLEGILSFFTPGGFSDAVEVAIQGSLPNPAASPDDLAPCESIGVRRLENSADDMIISRRPSGGGRTGLRAVAAAGLRKQATVRFLRITRKPPTFGYTPPDDAGRFQAYLNGALALFPDLPQLRLPAAGGSAEINLCRTVLLDGSDRLQIIFANTHGGGVWSQFAEHQRFGAGSPHRMTTGRSVVVAGRQQQPGEPPPPGGTRPRSVILREYELLYTIDYAAPPEDVGAERPPVGRPGEVTRPPTERAPEAERREGSGEACRNI